MTPSVSHPFTSLRPWTAEGIPDRIQGPVLVQAGLLAEAPDNCATHVRFYCTRGRQPGPSANLGWGERWGVVESEGGWAVSRRMVVRNYVTVSSRLVGQ